MPKLQNRRGGTAGLSAEERDFRLGGGDWRAAATATERGEGERGDSYRGGGGGGGGGAGGEKGSSSAFSTARTDDDRGFGSKRDRVWRSSEVVQLLCDVLDCVVDAGDLCQHDAYLWVKSVLPRELWFSVWGALSSSKMEIGRGDEVSRPETPPWECSVESHTRSLMEPENVVVTKQQSSTCKSLVHQDLATLAATRTLVGTSQLERSVAGSSPIQTPRRSTVAVTRSPVYHLNQDQDPCHSHWDENYSCHRPRNNNHGFHDDDYDGEATLLPRKDDVEEGSSRGRKGTLAEYFQKRGSHTGDSEADEPGRALRRPSASYAASDAERRGQGSSSYRGGRDDGDYDDQESYSHSYSRGGGRSGEGGGGSVGGQRHSEVDVNMEDDGFPRDAVSNSPSRRGGSARGVAPESDPPPRNRSSSLAKRRQSTAAGLKLGGNGLEDFSMEANSLQDDRRRSLATPPPSPPPFPDNRGKPGFGASLLPASVYNIHDDNESVSTTRNKDTTVQVMDHWLDGGMDEGTLTPFQVADWLRTLPVSKFEREAKKTLARRVLHYGVDGEEFYELLTSGKWAELDLRDEREAVTLLRLFKQRQHEGAMAQAARNTAIRNAAFKRKGAKVVA